MGSQVGWLNMSYLRKPVLNGHIRPETYPATEQTELQTVRYSRVADDQQLTSDWVVLV